LLNDKYFSSSYKDNTRLVLGSYSRYLFANNSKKDLLNDFPNAYIRSCSKRELDIIDKRDKEQLKYITNKYCIQLLSIFDNDLESNRKIKDFLSNRDNAFIMDKDSRKILLIGEFNKFSDAKLAKESLELDFKDIFIRNCSSEELDILKKSDSKSTQKIEDKPKIEVSSFYSNYRDKDILKEYLNSFELSNFFYASNNTIAQESSKSSLEDSVLSIKDEYLNVLKSKNKNLGLFVSGGYEKFLNTQTTKKDYKYSLKFQWDIFSNGYYESQKKLNSKIDDAELQFLQLLLKVSESDFDSKLQEIDKMRTYIKGEFFYKQLLLYESIYNKRVKQMKAGFNTVDDIYYLEKQIRNSKTFYKFYSSQPQAKIPKKLFDILSKIEYLTLIDMNSFVDKVIKSDYSLRINEVSISNLDNLSNYKDDIKLELFLEREYDYVSDYINSSYQDSYGFNFKSPLFIDDEDKKLVNLENQTNIIKAQLLEKDIKDRVKSLYYEFGYSKANLDISKSELNYLLKLKEILSIKKEKYIREFSSDPFRDYELNSTLIQKQYFEILSNRLNIYRVLLELVYISNSDSLKDIIK
jgi:uncharacterized tellurite resistance protein B-like protein